MGASGGIDIDSIYNINPFDDPTTDNMILNEFGDEDDFDREDITL